MSRFVAIDVEKLSPNHLSICSIGLAVFENNQMVDSFYSLVCPPISEESIFCTRVNHLSYEQVKNAPSFYDLWINKIQSIIRNCDYLVAHNSSTEMYAIYTMLDYYNLSPDLELTWKDSMFEAQDKINMNKHGLEQVCYALNVSLRNHHNALDDAIACGECHIKMMNITQLDMSGTTLSLDNDFVFHPSEHKKDNIMTEFELCGKNVCITGVFGRYSNREYLKEELSNLGVKVTASVTKSLNYLICGDNPGQSKIEKSKKQSVIILTEGDIYEMIDNYNNK